MSLDFGKRLRNIRKQNGLTQAELGELVGVSKRVISYYEQNGKYSPADFIKKLCAALKVSADSLLNTTKVEKQSKQDGKLVKRFRSIENLPPSKKKTIIQVIDAFLEQNEKRK